MAQGLRRPGNGTLALFLRVLFPNRSKPARRYLHFIPRSFPIVEPQTKAAAQTPARRPVLLVRHPRKVCHAAPDAFCRRAMSRESLRGGLPVGR